MKTFFRVCMKWLFVVVIPFGLTAVVLGNYYYNGWLGFGKFLFELLILAVAWLNAIFYLTMMRKTKLLPKVTVDFIPIFGIAFGVDGSFSHYNKWVLVLPFVAIEFHKK